MVEENPAGSLKSKVEKLGQDLSTLVQNIQSGVVTNSSQNSSQHIYQASSSPAQPEESNEFSRGVISSGGELYDHKPVPNCYYYGEGDILQLSVIYLKKILVMVWLKEMEKDLFIQLGLQLVGLKVKQSGSWY